jgi:hypothetical protein
MKNLFDAQQKVADHFLSRHLDGKNTLDTSDLGTGKTVVACWLVDQLQQFNPETKFAVICPKAAIGAWHSELEDAGLDPLFVLNYEKLRTGNTEWMKKIGKKIMHWKLPTKTVVIVDESHHCRGHYTQNAQLVISLVQQGHKLHLMSATAAEDPTHMRALGFALGLHSLNKPKGTRLNFAQWMMSHGCKQNEWNAWEFRDRKKLEMLHTTLYETPACQAARVTIADMPEAFKGNRVSVELVEFQNLNKINSIYHDLGITPAIVEQFVAEGTVEDSEFAIVNILRARQLTEALKVPEFYDYTRDFVDQGFSVVNFVNFTETREALSQKLGCAWIAGGDDDRQKVIDRFQADQERMLVVNAKAGGAAISLHDVRGKHPRVALISPDFSATTYKQVLGRIYRNGAKSDAVQKVMVAKGTVEEDVMRAINRKLKNLEALHGK